MKIETAKDVKFILRNTISEWYTHILIALIKVLITLCSFAHPIVQSLIIDCGLNFQPDQAISVSGIFQYLVSGA